MKLENNVNLFFFFFLYFCCQMLIAHVVICRWGDTDDWAWILSSVNQASKPYSVWFSFVDSAVKEAEQIISVLNFNSSTVFWCLFFPVVQPKLNARLPGTNFHCLCVPTCVALDCPLVSFKIVCA